jgi:hypothetical protein
MYYLNNNYTKNSFLTNMSVTNTIFNTFSRKLVTNERANSLDYGIMNTEEEKYFNTYRYWKPFFATNQPLIGEDGSVKEYSATYTVEETKTNPATGEEETKKVNKSTEPYKVVGVPNEIQNAILSTKSLFNNVNAVPVQSEYRDDINMPLLDSPDSRISRKSKMACTITDLVNASVKGELGRQVYNFSDFAYCKHLGKIPNNYLITFNCMNLGVSLSLPDNGWIYAKERAEARMKAHDETLDMARAKMALAKAITRISTKEKRF